MAKCLSVEFILVRVPKDSKDEETKGFGIIHNLDLESAYQNLKAEGIECKIYSEHDRDKAVTIEEAKKRKPINKDDENYFIIRSDLTSSNLSLKQLNQSFKKLGFTSSSFAME